MGNTCRKDYEDVPITEPDKLRVEIDHSPSKEEFVKVPEMPKRSDKCERAFQELNPSLEEADKQYVALTNKPMIKFSEPEQGPFQKSKNTYENLNFTYFGQYKEGKRNGWGETIYSDGSCYIGYYQEDRESLFGWQIDQNGNYLMGEFVAGKFNKGKGKSENQNEYVYEGEYERSMKTGTGLFKWKDGTFYKGCFKDNDLHGEGVYSWADGRIYIGNWSKSKMNGLGLYYWPDGRSYEGEYIDGKKHGKGIFTWKDGSFYIGEWKNGLQDGEGIKYSSDKSIEGAGKWKKGELIKSTSKNSTSAFEVLNSDKVGEEALIELKA